MQDFVCTNAVSYLFRDGFIDAVVQMRSNDVVYGYRNDFAWQTYALRRVVEKYNDMVGRVRSMAQVGTIHWQAASLHIYPRHYSVIMKEILSRLEKSSTGTKDFCTRKTVVAKAVTSQGNFYARNGGPERCLREEPGHILDPEHSSAL
jgi:hypothetical protein